MNAELEKKLWELIEDANSNGRDRLDSSDWEEDDLAELRQKFDAVLLEAK